MVKAELTSCFPKLMKKMTACSLVATFMKSFISIWEKMYIKSKQCFPNVENLLVNHYYFGDTPICHRVFFPLVEMWQPRTCTNNIGDLKVYTSLI